MLGQDTGLEDMLVFVFVLFVRFFVTDRHISLII